MAFGLAVLAILILGVAAAAPARSMLRQGEPSQPLRNAGELARAIAAALKTDPAWQAPIRGSVTLPETGADILRDQQLAPARQARITWRSSNPAVISDVDRKTKDGIVAKGAVTRGSEDVDVRLTAAVHVPGAAILAVPIDVTVLAKPAHPAKNEAYLFAYFPDDSADGEKIRFAISEGNNALQWKTLNDARPVLESSLGTLGLRDPFIMRSAEGDRFFLMATDLSAGRTGWSDATRKGSPYLEIWESVDLVNWGNQRHVEVNLPNAGMTWAPEAMYDASIDAYVVYWTSQLFKDDARRQPDGNGPQILMSTTRDFRTFSTPQPWFKSADLPALVRDRGMIDTTVLQEGDHFYRFTKVTEAKGCPSADIIGQRSPSLRAAGASGSWQVVSRCIGRTAGTPEVEGPSIFKANDGDTSGYKYYLWVDHYSGIGYIPLGTNALEDDIKWTRIQDARLPPRPRHGSVLSITAEERDALVARWGNSSDRPRKFQGGIGIADH